jgi:hypothetical protein
VNFHESNRGEENEVRSSGYIGFACVRIASIRGVTTAVSNQTSGAIQQ